MNPADAVEGNTGDRVLIIPSQKRGKNEPGSSRIQFGQKSISIAGERIEVALIKGGLEGIYHGKIRRRWTRIDWIRSHLANNIGVAATVHSNVICLFFAMAAKESAVRDQSVRVELGDERISANCISTSVISLIGALGGRER